MSTPAPASTEWVPLWDLRGGVDLQYVGSWQSGTTYNDGQVAVYNGLAYMCVRQTTAAPVPWPLSSGTPSYGTTLPTGPVDGQEAILVDSLSDPTYQWRFRFNARSTSPYKWEFVGGTPRLSEVPTQETTASTTYAVLATAGPSFTVPRAGDYVVGFGAYMQTSAAGIAVYASYDIGATAASDTWGIVGYTPPGVGGASMFRQNRHNGLAASAAIVAKYRVNTGGVSYFGARHLSILPVRVS